MDSRQLEPITEQRQRYYLASLIRDQVGGIMTKAYWTFNNPSLHARKKEKRLRRLKVIFCDRCINGLGMGKKATKLAFYTTCRSEAPTTLIIDMFIHASRFERERGM